ncbi:MAG: hypothetical protein MUF21_00870 [Gemmatimonadaceae bacterium]|nr:hypothetical protein [Gemmatimonadaceae bacterium]
MSLRRLLTLLVIAVAFVAAAQRPPGCCAADAQPAQATSHERSLPDGAARAHAPAHEHVPCDGAPARDCRSLGCPMSSGCAAPTSAEVAPTHAAALLVRQVQGAWALGVRAPAAPLLEHADPPPRG